MNFKVAAMTLLRHGKQEQQAMNEHVKSDPKVENPSAHFDHAHEVVQDASLSKAGKVKALDALEQDARQLAQASSEGMAGGERNKLHDVLVAKDKLGVPPMAPPAPERKN